VKTLPHLNIKYFPCPLSGEERTALANELTDTIATRLRVSPDVVSISLEEIAPEQWHATVVGPELEAHPERVIKHPNYPKQ
jgi:4-oxalocrotonate tautomerase